MHIFAQRMGSAENQLNMFNLDISYLYLIYILKFNQSCSDVATQLNIISFPKCAL